MNNPSGKSLLVLGRQSKLSLAELESRFGAEKLKEIGGGCTLLDLAPTSIDLDQLGGAVKLCEIIDQVDTTDWNKLSDFLIASVPGLLRPEPGKKIKLGLSLYDLTTSSGKLLATGLNIKKVLTKSGGSVRLVPNKTLSLNSASVFHNRLFGESGCEIVLARNGNKTVVARTQAVQNIDSYTRRDRFRPKRDSRVGMLPPKLAQIIINLALGQTSATAKNLTVLDPFCGTGVILQEAHLMGLGVVGTDQDVRMIEYSRENLNWLTGKDSNASFSLTSADATNYHWSDHFDLVASETYLGRPFTQQPSLELISKTASECNIIIKKFLQNLYGQIEPGARLALAVPAWRAPNGSFKHLSLLDSLAEIGYNRLRFEHATNSDLLYHRENQFVGRELLVLTRK